MDFLTVVKENISILKNQVSVLFGNVFSSSFLVRFGNFPPTHEQAFFIFVGGIILSGGIFFVLRKKMHVFKIKRGEKGNIKKNKAVSKKSAKLQKSLTAVFAQQKEKELQTHPPLRRAFSLLSIIFLATLIGNLPEKYRLADAYQNWQNQKARQTSGAQFSASLNGMAMVAGESQIKNNLPLVLAATDIATNNIQATANPNAKTIQLVGTLADTDGKMVNGTHSIRFAIYDSDRTTVDPYPSDTDKNQRIWEEVQSVDIKNGVFNVELGKINNLPTTLAKTNTQFYLAMRVENDSEMVPRKKIGPSFFALNSENAITLNGKKIGNQSGDIPILNQSGQIDIQNLPTGNGKDQLVTGNDKRFTLSISGQKYFTISGQTFKLNKIDLNSNTQGTLSVGQGGTGLANFSQGDLLYASGADALAGLTAGTNGQILTINNGIPAWKTLTGNGIETDPIFSAWNKSTGISITESQISDFKNYLTTETDPTIYAWAKAAVKPTYTATEVGLGNVTNESKTTMFSNPTFTGTVSGITAAMVGLGNVPNLTFSGSNTGDETTATIKTKLGFATTTLDGYLTAGDWNIFNNKQPAGSYLTGTKVDSFNTRTGAVTLSSADVTNALAFTPYDATNPNSYITGNQTITLSGDIAGSGTTSIITTLPNVNSNLGTFNNLTVNAKGQVTGGSNVSYLTTESDAAFTAWYNAGSPSLANLTLTNQLISTVATGTAPLQVASTTKVANLNADLLDGFDSSAFGDATAANQTTIMTRIGTNADVASMSSTLFAGQKYIANGVDAVATNVNTVASGVNTLVNSTSGTSAGIFFNVGGAPNYCKEKIIDTNGFITNYNINDYLLCGPGLYCNAGVCNGTSACGTTTTISDADGNVYNTISISNQCWMATNMMTTKYPDGTAITRGGTTNTWGNVDSAFYAYPPNTANTAEETLANIISNNLGFVYQWSAAMHGSTVEGAQGICPTGWHIPTDAEQYILESRLKDLTATCDAARSNAWDCASAGTKLKIGGSSGANVPLAGYRNTDGSFYVRGTYVDLWSSSPSSTSAWYRFLNSTNATVYRFTNSKAYGFSVRCLKN